MPQITPRLCNGSTGGFGPSSPSSNLGWGILNIVMQIITPLLTLQNQLRIFHWQTKSYSEHKALGKAYEDLDGLVDTFVEVYFGKYGNINAKESFKLNLENYAEKNCRDTVQEGIQYLENFSNNLNENDTELLNIRDEMLAVLERTKYLLRLT